MLWRSALRSDCTALLGPGSRRRTHCAHCVRCAQTAAASQLTKRAGARRPRPCAARRHRNRPCRVPPAAKLTSGGGRTVRFCRPNKRLGVRAGNHRGSKGACGQAAQCLGGAEEVSRDTSGPGDRLCLANGRASRPGAACKARARGRARTRALRALTRRICPSAANAVSVASYATRPRDRASQGTLAQRGPATNRCRPPARALARTEVRAQHGPRGSPVHVMRADGRRASASSQMPRTKTRRQ